MKTLLFIISIICALNFSIGFAADPIVNAVQNGLPINIPAPIKVIEGQCLISQICEVSKKSSNDPDNPVISYFGVISYQLRNDVAYIINDGKISKVNEVSVQNETQKNVNKLELAETWCTDRKKQFAAFFSLCK